MQFRKNFSGVLCAIILAGIIGTVEAGKSVYVISNHGYDLIQAYKIEDTSLTHQLTANTNNGPIDLAIHESATYGKWLFCTYEFSNEIALIDGQTMATEDTFEIPNVGEWRLAGITIDTTNSKLYVVDRETTHLYSYTWDPSDKTLTADFASPYYKVLSGISENGAFGIALDEENELLYVSDDTDDIKYYKTGDWTKEDEISNVSCDVKGIAIDVENQLLYYGSYGDSYLYQWDITEDEDNEDSELVGSSVAGIAVDQETSLVYITTYEDGDIDTYYRLMVYDSSLEQQWSSDVIGNIATGGPAGLVVSELGYSENFIAHWKLDETEEDNAEDSVGDNDGTLNYFPIDDSQWVEGKIDNALDFGGTDDYVSLDYSVGALESPSVTISAWIKADILSESSTDWRPILTQFDYDGDSYGYYLYIKGKKPAFGVGESTYREALSDNSINTGTWYHIAGTNDGEKIKIYVDGKFEKSEYSTGLRGVEHAAYIGYDDETSPRVYFDGIIDDVRIYSWAMTQDEIRDIMFEGSEKFALVNDSGVRVAWFDNKGNLFLNGDFTDNKGSISATANDEFIFKDSGDDIIALIDRATGNMEITGTLSEEQSFPLSSGTYDFVIKESGGDPVSLIRESDGSILLTGKMYGGD